MLFHVIVAAYLPDSDRAGVYIGGSQEAVDRAEGSSSFFIFWVDYVIIILESKN